MAGVRGPTIQSAPHKADTDPGGNPFGDCFEVLYPGYRMRAGIVASGVEVFHQVFLESGSNLFSVEVGFFFFRPPLPSL